MRFHIIIASHNRQEVTVTALNALRASAYRAEISVSVTLFDDGSTDGTAETVSRNFPAVKILRGDGSNYWARSMAKAETEVMHSDFQWRDEEYVVWLNDDVQLDQDALTRIVPALRRNRDSVVIGAMRGLDSDKVTYTGLSRRGMHPLGVRPVRPTSDDQWVHTFNGNFVLVPASVIRRVGGLDGGYAHAFADIDYGFRCQKAGVPVVLAPDTYGVCPANPPQESGSLLYNWKQFTGVKGGGHPSSVVRILRKVAPIIWPAYLSSTYVLWWLRQAVSAARRSLK